MTNPITFDKDPIEKLVGLLQPGSAIPVFVNYAPERPKAGFMYIFEFSDKKFATNYREDKWRFKQWGQYSPKDFEPTCRKTYALHRVKPGPDRIYFTNKFIRRFFNTSLYPNRVLIWYQGDETIVPDLLAHGNARRRETKARNYVKIADSVKTDIKTAAKDKARVGEDSDPCS